MELSYLGRARLKNIGTSFDHQVKNKYFVENGLQKAKCLSRQISLHYISMQHADVICSAASCEQPLEYSK